jgi:hypothetical protein
VRIHYRLRQFWRTFLVEKEQLELDQALALLNPEQKALFTRMQQSEQNHAEKVLRRLLEQGENQPDLLVAALLHDVGKLCHRMSPLERAVVVLVKAVMPKLAHRWGELPPAGWDGLPAWRKAFILAEHHAEWGAEVARKSGVSVLTENLIRMHHYPRSQDVDSVETNLLQKLWQVDNES